MSNKLKQQAKFVSNDVGFTGTRGRWSSAVTDILELLTNLKYHTFLANQEVVNRYYRSVLGPLWMTIGTLTFVIGYATLAGFLFKLSIAEVIGYIATGAVFWTFISSALTEAAFLYPSSASEATSDRTNFLALSYKVLMRNLIAFLHAIPIILLVVGYFQGLTWWALLAIPGTILATLILLPLSLIISILAARFRDIGQLTITVTQFMFYMTPILWKPETLGNGMGQYIVIFNPFYYLIALVRDPLMGNKPDFMIWAVSAGIATFGFLIATLLYTRFRTRIIFWI
ncbi:MAG: ABC transporter permease [Robiginitomaculum sp.]|nr:ABC transporter permease [Robiginitomaculum sp.]